MLEGNDTVNDNSASGTHALLGGPGGDTLNGGVGPAIAAGGAGQDSITTRDSKDELYGNAHADVLDAGAGDDRLFGGLGSDILRAGDGDDIVYGGWGDDQLYGSLGHDLLIPGPGADQTYGGQGDDTVLTYDVCELSSGEIIDGGAGTDLLYIPVPLAQVQALGVTITGFESIVERPGREPLAECVEAYTDWELLGRAVEITSPFDEHNADVVPPPPLPSDQNSGPTLGGNSFVPMETGGIAIDVQSMLIYSVEMSLDQANAFALTVDPQTANGQTTTPLADTATSGSGACDRLALNVELHRFPRTAIGILETAWNGLDPHCTGALVGPRHVLTAAHCVYRSDNEFTGGVPGLADSYLFTAGQTPIGSAATPVLDLEWIWYPRAWEAGLYASNDVDDWPHGSDIALLIYDIPAGATPPGIEIGGWFGWWWQSGNGFHDRHYFLRGYPMCTIDFCQGTAGTNCDWMADCDEDQLYGAAESCDCATFDSFDNEAEAVPSECGGTCWNSRVPHACFATKGQSGGPLYFYQTAVNPAVHVIGGVHIEQQIQQPDTWVGSRIRRMTPMVSDWLIYWRETYP